MTPTLMPRLPGWTALWLPVQSPPSHSPPCAGPVTGGRGGLVAKERVGASGSS